MSMIPARNWDILINRLRAGDTILEACAASQVSKASLYRMLRDPSFRDIFDEAIFYGNSRKDAAKKEIEERKMDHLKKIVLRKRT